MNSGVLTKNEKFFLNRTKCSFCPYFVALQFFDMIKFADNTILVPFELHFHSINCNIMVKVAGKRNILLTNQIPGCM
ncbi:hypothetical protein D7V86_21070 [bacterium D16-51]|nr:hypothetical protein D7V96_21195 [bacterium D16-59]RKI55837.1 hypothetical protein D7V86_21070 [bacterium D16-51]